MDYSIAGNGLGDVCVRSHTEVAGGLGECEGKRVGGGGGQTS